MNLPSLAAGGVRRPARSFCCCCSGGGAGTPGISRDPGRSRRIQPCCCSVLHLLMLFATNLSVLVRRVLRSKWLLASLCFQAVAARLHGSAGSAKQRLTQSDTACGTRLKSQLLFGLNISVLQVTDFGLQPITTYTNQQRNPAPHGWMND